MSHSSRLNASSLHPVSAMLRLPAEINERILTMSDPRVVSTMAQSCSFFRNLVYNPVDQHLWRSLFLSRFDDPRATLELRGEDHTTYPWRSILQRRVRSEILLTERAYKCLHPDERRFALETLSDTVQCAQPPHILKGHSLDLQWTRRLIEEVDIFYPLRRPHGLEQFEESELELLSRLHVYYGLTNAEKQLPAAQYMRTNSRCFVYDLRKYGKDNLWGPFKRNSGGKAVSWVHIDHIVNVISMNLEDILDLWEERRPSTGLLAARPYSAPGMENRSDRDWAGVEGKWYRYVCFMDYRDLFAFNFSTSTDSGSESLDTAIFEDDSFEEAIRLIELNLRITSVIPCASNPNRPVLKFGGSSKGSHGNEARVVGSVRVTPDGQIAWKFISVYDGRTQWSSEGIQIGGPGSATGVVGTWSATFHTDRDPVGPFWLWKSKTRDTHGYTIV